jgi:hypothetical protein
MYYHINNNVKKSFMILYRIGLRVVIISEAVIIKISLKIIIKIIHIKLLVYK